MNRIHPLSVLLGLAFAGICFIAMSQSPVISATNLRVEYMPHPRDMVQIQEGIPFVVPQNRIFVLTALGDTGPSVQTAIYVNGIVAATDTTATGMVGSTVHPVPTGFSVSAGSTITVSAYTPSTHARAWGYLSSL